MDKILIRYYIGMILAQAKKELNRLANPKKAEFLKRFFKTGKGDYAEGDKFLGIVVPATRIVAKKYRRLKIKDVFLLLRSKIHEERLMAIFILVDQYNAGDKQLQNKIYRNYLKLAADYVNNWDLVDSSAAQIVGKHLINRPRDILHRLAHSKNLWERRIAIISTFEFIRNNNYEETLKIAKILLHDKHDLIHKAVGWMLREMGKKSQITETKFLNQYAVVMPRTMLRYAIEKYPENIRKKYLTLKK